MELIHEADRFKWMAYSNHSTKCFTKGDIDRITKNYRTSLGSGAFGEVYEGVLDDGNMVAVKRFIHNVKENFAKELIVHREINHKNVVRLIGCCEEENALMLVTEYIANGNLSDFLHNNNGPIPFDVRLRIAIECAEALAYMHSHMYTQVIHGDIKPGNILLDSNFHAKLSDFGISRLANTDNTLHTKNVIGSIGYMDPLFARDGCLTVKYDVYSFGVVLLELITRKKAIAVLDNVNIVSAFTNALASGVRGVRGMLDAEIASKNNMRIIERVAKLAGECLTMERGKRPEMVDVMERLRSLRKATHQDQGQQRVDRFSWFRKSKPAPSAASTVTTFDESEPSAASTIPDMFSWLRKSKPAPSAASTATTFDESEPSAASTIPAKILPSHELMCRQFSFTEMKAATNNFDKSHIIDLGGGWSERIYLGKIDGGATKVAINKPSYVSDPHLYIEVMSKLRHGNLMPLIGYCHNKKEMLLVYEYMARGNLMQYLYGYRTQQQPPPISWKLRVEACIGAARGLRYLHESQIIHGDVKTENILLDEEWLAKITHLNFPNIAMFYDSAGYLDPEYIFTGQLTEKSDVYSFGIVLLDVLLAQSARPPINPPSPGDEAHSLAARVWRRKEEGNLDQMVDPYLKGKINPQCLDKFINTAKNCLAYRGIDRPSMGDVILDLEYALQLQEGPHC